jgi:polyhydroxyalkanoate synthesis regulator phasin
MKILKWGLAALAILVLAGVIGFGVLASSGRASADDTATATPTPGAKGPGRERYEELLAQKLGITAQQLQTAQKATLDQLIDEAVAAGRLTPDQAAKLKSRDLNGKPGLHLGQLKGRVKTAVGDVLDAAAKTIGISKDDLKSNLKQGKSLTQIAADHKVSRDQLKSGITTEIQGQIQAGVASGKLTQQQADKLSAGLSSHLDKIIDRTHGAGRKNK